MERLDQDIADRHSTHEAARAAHLRAPSARRESAALASAREDIAEIELHPPTAPRRRPFPVGWLTFFLGVVLPFLASVAYFAFYASDQYVSEVRFAVRAPASDSTDDTSQQQQNVLTANTLSQDAYVVTSFIHSSEMLRRLGEHIDVRGYFDQPSIDYPARLDADASPEKLLDYWSKQVTTYIDGPSGIVTLYVRAFSPQAAQDLAARITQESEKLVNELSERARADVVARAQDEVTKTEDSYRNALTALNVYQNQSGILDPSAQAGETGKLLIGLMSQKLEIDAKLFVLTKSLSDDAPNVQQLKRTQQSLQEQIDGLRAKLANDRTADDNLSKALKRFSELDTDRVLAAGLYEAARRNLAAAQAEAIRKSVYVTVFVPPALPEDATYPRRTAGPLIILLGLMVGWGILALLWASVEDHRL